MSMMEPEDPRVKDLQQLAWSLQTLTNKPGARLPDKFKTECYKLAGKVSALCNDVAYTEEEDFVQKSQKFFALLEAKKKECAEVEEAEKAKVTGKCYKATAGGGYTVGDVTDKSAASRAQAEVNIADAGRKLTSTAGGARVLSASELISRCKDDPEALSLCDMGLGDGDMDTLCQALKQQGAEMRYLDISHNLLADVGVQKLVSALATGTCPKLQALYIGYNQIGDLGLQMLKGGLAALRKTLVVHLEDGVERGQSCPPAGDTCSATSEPATSSRDTAQELSQTASSVDEETHPAKKLPSSGSSADCAESTQAGDISTSSSSPSSTPAVGSTAAPCDDVLRIELIQAATGDGSDLRAVLSLPEDVSSAADLDVDVSLRRIVIRRVGGSLIADAALPCEILPDSSQAVFSRKRRTMTMTFQTAAAA